MFWLFGALSGFSWFLFCLESKYLGMGNILFRKDENLQHYFSFDNLLEYIKLPFYSLFPWYPQNIFFINWIITVFTGTLTFHLFHNFIFI